MSSNFTPAPNIICLIGQTIKTLDIDREEAEIKITTESGKKYLLYHSQDCCESVRIRSVLGSPADLLGAPILSVTERIQSGGTSSESTGSCDDWPEDEEKGDYLPESYTWTTFTFTTSKGTFRIRWFGESNGYYSESVSFCEGFNPGW